MALPPALAALSLRREERRRVREAQRKTRANAEAARDAQRELATQQRQSLLDSILSNDPKAAEKLTRAAAAATASASAAVAVRGSQNVPAAPLPRVLRAFDDEAAARQEARVGQAQGMGKRDVLLPATPALVAWADATDAHVGKGDGARGRRVGGGTSKLRPYSAAPHLGGGATATCVHGQPPSGGVSDDLERELRLQAERRQRLEAMALEARRAKEARAILRLQASTRGWLVRRVWADRLARAVAEARRRRAMKAAARVTAATTIQRHARGFAVLRRWGAVVAMARGQARDAQKKERQRREQAARLLTRCWRGAAARRRFGRAVASARELGRRLHAEAKTRTAEEAKQRAETERVQEEARRAEQEAALRARAEAEARAAQEARAKAEAETQARAQAAREAAQRAAEEREAREAQALEERRRLEAAYPGVVEAGRHFEQYRTALLRRLGLPGMSYSRLATWLVMT
jgi:hypothetical protein